MTADVFPGASEDGQRRELARAVERIGLGVDELWQRYLALGGAVGPVEVDAYLHGVMSLPALQRDILAHAVNERLAELPRWVPYSRTIRHPTPERGLLAALVMLLDRGHRAAPELLPAVAAAGAAALDAELVTYLVDYDQRWLVPLPGRRSDPDGRERLPVDGSLAGRAYRHAEILPSDRDGRPRLWIPLVDGVDRLGVLEVTLTDPADVGDPVLRDQLRRFAGLLGQLIGSQGQYGDGLQVPRLGRPRSPSAELIWSLLPPLTAGTGAVSLAGALEPSSDVGGDVFDYALSDTTVQVAVFDAAGHDLGSGLVAAAALAAYRAARRCGRSLYHQVRAVDEVVAAHFSALVTGVVAELDLTTGRLRYLVAGHPHPLLLRRGKVVKALPAGRRLPFGLDTYEATVGEEVLEPGDWLVLHTDGLTEARDDRGRLFGDQRLVDFLEREAAAGHPPPETVRRLVHAVLAHQNGVLQDDATVLLVRWDTHDHRP